jgi:hypothetical protein
MRFLLLIRGAAEDEAKGALAPGGIIIGGEVVGGATAGEVEEEVEPCA